MLKSREHEGLGDVEEYREVIRKVGSGYNEYILYTYMNCQQTKDITNQIF